VNLTRRARLLIARPRSDAPFEGCARPRGSQTCSTVRGRILSSPQIVETECAQARRHCAVANGHVAIVHRAEYAL
jgi:hypothetical protein